MSGTDIRVSNPNSTSLYDSLTLKPTENKKTEQAIPQQAPVKDTAVTEKHTAGKVPGTEISFSGHPVNAIPVLDDATSQPLLFQLDENGNYARDEEGNFLVVESGGMPMYVQADENNQPILDKNNKPVILSPADINKNDSMETIKASPSESIMPLTDLETGDVLFFKVDANGHPVTDKNGDYILDPEKGQPVFVKVDQNGNPVKDENGKFAIVSQGGESISDVPQSFNRLALGLLGKKLAQGAVNKTAGFMVKGFSVGIPFTNASLGFGVKHAVAKAVGKEVQAIQAAKSGATTIVGALKTTSATATEGALKTLTEAGRLGKGVETLGIKEASKIAGSRIKAIQHGFEGLKGVTAEIAGGGVKAAGNVAKKTVVGGAEKVLRKGVEEGIESGIKTVIKRGGKEIAETVTTKGVQKALSVTAEKAAVGATAKFTAKYGAKIGAIAPVIGVAAGVGITAWDAKDAIEKTRDSKASMASKTLAWTTVGLDALAVGAEFSAKGKPVGWAAIGLSIGTSALSDYLR